MKTIILTTIIFCTTLILSLSAQNILWKKNFGLSSADDYGRAVLETNDGGIAIVGYTGSYGAGGFDVWLIKTDADGNILWTKTYGGVGDDYGYSLKQTDDDGFIIGGATNSFGVGGLDYYLIKTDSLGDTLWTKTFGGANDDICWSLEVTGDGYVLAGGKNMQPSTPDFWIIKLNLNGNIIWEKTYGTSGAEVPWSINNISEGGFIITGYYPIDDFDGWLMRVGPNGDSLWTKTYGGTLGDSFLDGKQTSDKGFILTGGVGNSTIADLWLLKTDSLGNVEWEKTYDYHNEYDIGYSVQQTSDGGYIVCGSGGWDVDYGWIIRTNEFGDIMWTKVVSSYSGNNVFSSLDTDFYSVSQLSNGDYIATGNQPYLPVSDHAQQLILLKISSDIVPVELTSFTATAQQNNVTLNWQTATETNNSGFKIERKQVGSPQSSVSNQDWNQIAFIPGFGTTSEPKSYSFTDENLSAGKYQYRLKQIDFDGSFEFSNTVEVEITAPTEFTLEQNYPNPFNPTTKIKYTVPSVTLRWQSHRQAQSDILVSLKVFDVLGNEVATLVNETQQPGTYEIEFNVGQAISLSSGVYYYQLRVGGFVETKKMILLR